MFPRESFPTLTRAVGAAALAAAIVVAAVPASVGARVTNAPDPPQDVPPYLDDGHAYTLTNAGSGDHLVARQYRLNEEDEPILLLAATRSATDAAAWTFEERHDDTDGTSFRLRNGRHRQCATPGPQVEHRTAVKLGPCDDPAAFWRAAEPRRDWAQAKLLAHFTGEVMQPVGAGSEQIVALNEDSELSGAWWSITRRDS